MAFIFVMVKCTAAFSLILLIYKIYLAVLLSSLDGSSGIRTAQGIEIKYASNVGDEDIFSATYSVLFIVLKPSITVCLFSLFNSIHLTHSLFVVYNQNQHIIEFF